MQVFIVQYKPNCRLEKKNFITVIWAVIGYFHLWWYWTVLNVRTEGKSVPLQIWLQLPGKVGELPSLAPDATANSSTAIDWRGNL